jgi:glutathione S-transferase
MAIRLSTPRKSGGFGFDISPGPELDMLVAIGSRHGLARAVGSSRAARGNHQSLRREISMKLYMHPVSTATRPVRLLIAENGIQCDEEMVDILKGAHHQEPYPSLNPSQLVPMLEDDDLRLTESSAILKYLADKYDLPSYPKDLKKRAKVNEVMDWLNTQLYRDLGYGLVYPQLFAHHKRRSDEAHAGAIAWGQQGANDHWLGPKNQYLCGDQLTIADYFGACLVSIGELLGCDFGAYPNIQRWLGTMKKLKAWNKVNEAFNGYVAANKGKKFEIV